MHPVDPARQVLINTLDFRAPMPKRWLQRLLWLALPWLQRGMFGGLDVELDDESKTILSRIKGERCLLLPNHPAEWDPLVMMAVSKQINEFFYYVAAREVFDYNYGIRGWLFQRLGVYSLIRGSNDRASFKMSMDIMAENQGRLVIFVEGEISNQNDSLLPLEPGVLQLAFLSLSELYRKASKNLLALPHLYVCPVAIRYVYQEDGLNEAITHALTQLEAETGLHPNPEDTLLKRITAIGSKILDGTAKQFGYALAPEASLVQNVEALSGFMLAKLEQVINLHQGEDLSFLDRIRAVRNRVDRVIFDGYEKHPTGYQARLFNHQKAVLSNFYLDLDRLVNFIAIYDGYLHDQMPTNRAIEIIRRMEREVFGAYRLVHPRKAVVKVLEPIDLKAHFKDFLADKRQTVHTLTHQLESQLYTGLFTTLPE